MKDKEYYKSLSPRAARMRAHVKFVAGKREEAFEILRYLKENHPCCEGPPD